MNNLVPIGMYVIPTFPYYSIDLGLWSWQPIQGEGRNLERRDVERQIFRNFEIANIKIKKISHSIVLFLN